MANTPKSVRVTAAREQAARLKAADASAARRQRAIVIVLVVVGLLVFGSIAAFIVTNRPADTPDFEDVDNPLDSVTAPSGANGEGGIQVGAAGVAVPSAVSGDAVVVTVYFDYMCPICGYFEELNGADLAQLRAQGDVVIEYRPVSILDRYSRGTLYSTRSANAAALVADRAPEAFVAFHELLFVNQPEEGTSGLTDAQLAEIALLAGVPADVSATIGEGLETSDADSFADWVAAATEQAVRDFAPQFGTPTILIDGQLVTFDWRVDGSLAAAIAAALE